MRLNELNAAAGLAASSADPEISAITADSRVAGAGSLFVAVPGSRADGRDFVADAVGRGAVAVLAPPGTPVPAPAVGVSCPDPRRALALIAAAFHRRQPRVVAAVTGTNGKTSVASFARQIWEATGRSAASLGTLGCSAPGFADVPPLTTPDPVALHRVLAALAAAGYEHVAMEASSHGLDQRRLDGVRLAAAAFTNLTHEHLDYHGTMQAYLAAKARLFDSLLPPGAAAVINADVPEHAALAAASRARGARVLSFGARGADLALLARRSSPHGQTIDIEVLGRRASIDLALMGAFQGMNVLAALGLAIGSGSDPDAALAALPRLAGVPGRMQQVGAHPTGAAVFVDYAHKPHALETAIAALRPHARGRLAVVFGCGGDRDRAKRPIMGEIAARLADRVIVTDDNPRSEAPAAIRAAVLAGCREALAAGARAEVTEIGDRAVAIGAGIEGLAEGDLLLIAGKGHETGQIVGTTVLPFDDAAVARAALAERGGSVAA
ncbi:MAG: UDP-N-acetylmuramoyl-L-alanyl-D-glutamate--2,6-diaminopimelate ligase [Alphaproteobacteria bacterium]|nr:UDP-N-acetylmuramoyl-L-alanyl-D-glutamate--2,6-diaminopimelate ligase [Alphaproteobacteria bacterium]